MPCHGSNSRANLRLLQKWCFPLLTPGIRRHETRKTRGEHYSVHTRGENLAIIPACPLWHSRYWPQ